MDIPKRKGDADKIVCIAVIWGTIIGLFPIFFVLYHIQTNIATTLPPYNQ